MAIDPDDVTLESATMTLAALPHRQGYAEAMQRGVPDTTFRIIVVIAMLSVGGLAYGIYLYFGHSWLRFPTWGLMAVILLIFFNALRTRAAIGVGGRNSQPEPVVVLALHPTLDPDTGAIAPHTGGRLDLVMGKPEAPKTLTVTCPATLYEMVSPGDGGIATLAGDAPGQELSSFQRL